MVDIRFFPKKQDILPSEFFNSSEVFSSTEDLICGVSEMETAGLSDCVLFASKKYLSELEATKAGFVITSAKLREFVPQGIVAFICDEPHLRFIDLIYELYETSESFAAESSSFEGVSISSGAIIGTGCKIGSGTIIGPNAVIGNGVCIGRNCNIGANVTIEYSLIGDEVNIQAGSVIGSCGFGWLDHGKSNTKIPQIGRVILQNGVEVGPNCSVDRGALGDTILGENTKIGNGVVIGHNCKIGRNCLFAPTTGLAGTTIVGDGVIMGAGVGSSGHLEIGSGSVIYARSAVTKDWPAGSQLAGAPAQDIKEFWQELAMIRKLRRGGKAK